MGGSYDLPEVVPSPADEARLEEDGFQRQRWELHAHVLCRKCGAVVKGSPYERYWIDLHIAWHKKVEG